MSDVEIYQRTNALAVRVTAVEHNLKRLLAASGLVWEDPMVSHDVPPDVIAALKAGNKMEAIKLTRQHANIGLAEAKAAVEELEATLGG
jgi:ribosomal protein L7/L12